MLEERSHHHIRRLIGSVRRAVGHGYAVLKPKQVVYGTGVVERSPAFGLILTATADEKWTRADERMQVGQIATIGDQPGVGSRAGILLRRNTRFALLFKCSVLAEIPRLPIVHI